MIEINITTPIIDPITTSIDILVALVEVTLVEGDLTIVEIEVILVEVTLVKGDPKLVGVTLAEARVYNEVESIVAIKHCDDPVISAISITYNINNNHCLSINMLCRKFELIPIKMDFLQFF